MARPNRETVTTFVPSSLVASGANLTGKSRTPNAKGSAWQSRSWHFYDVIGEFEFVANWTGNLISRATLHVTKNGRRVGPSDPGAIALAELYGSESGRAGMLRAFGLHFTVAGEAWLVSWEKDGKREWDVVAPQNITERAGKYKVNDVDIDDPNPIVVRLWDPHPFLPKEATSPARSALPILAEIEKLTMHVAAQVDSRLANAGLLLLPNEMTVSASAQGTSTVQENASSAEKFVSEFYRVASTALSDPGSAAALVPIVISSDADNLEKVRLLEFWSKLDENAKELRTEAIHRLALSLDIPPEVLTGTGDANHWSAWSVDESSIKSHSEPLLARICADLTEGYLRYAIKDEVDDVSVYEIVADTSEMRLRPNRSQEAMEMYDRGELSDEALRRENGFDETDKPDDKAFKAWLLKKLATGSSTPEMMAAALAILGVELPVDVEPDAEGREDRPAPSLEDHPALDPPDVKQIEQATRQASLVAAAEQMVFRALERSGNKMGNQFKFTPDGVEPSERYLLYPKEVTLDQAEFLLKDSFTTCERFASQYQANPERLAFALEGYCHGLVRMKRPHTTEALAAYLTQMEV